MLTTVSLSSVMKNPDNPTDPPLPCRGWPASGPGRLALLREYGAYSDHGHGRTPDAHAANLTSMHVKQLLTVFCGMAGVQSTRSIRWRRAVLSGLRRACAARAT